MNEAEARLSAAWTADLPPARDAYFRLAVMARLERRQFALRMTLVLVLGAAATLLVAIAAPRLAAALSATPNGVLVLVGAMVLAATGWGLFRAFRPA